MLIPPSIRILLPLLCTSSVSPFVYSSGSSNISQYIIFIAEKINYYFLCEGSPKTQKPLKHNLNSMTADESRLTHRNNLKSPTKYRELKAYRKFCTSTTYLQTKFFTRSDFIQGIRHYNISQLPLLHFSPSDTPALSAYSIG